MTTNYAQPGVYPGISMQAYLAIPAVSASTVTTLLDECPFAAWFGSPFNPNPPSAPGDSEESDVGSIAHDVLLEGNTGLVEVIDPLLHLTEKTGNIPIGWGNKSIKAARDYAREQGKIPILKPKWTKIEAMVVAATSFIASLRTTESAIFAAFTPDGGQSELTIVWEDASAGVLCKGRVDRIDSGRHVIINYKTTSASVNPERYGRRQLLDYFVGGAFYVRGAQACFGVEPAHVYLCQEQAPPHLCSLVGLDPAWLDLGNQKVKAALREWQQCAADGVWPGYPSRVAYPELPPWEQTRWDERTVLTRDGVDYASQA